MLTAFSFAASVQAALQPQNLSYPVIDTNQTRCLGLKDTLSSCPVPGGETYGQDSQYLGFQPSYSDNQNGTVTDNITQLVWAQTIDINSDGKITAADKLNYGDALAYARTLELAGYSDWRLPTIKELYSLMMFDGQDPSGIAGKKGNVSIMPFINHQYFGFNSGDTEAGERLIDSQYVSSTKYVSTTMKGDETVFGVNFIDGRIKGYGTSSPRGGDKTFYVLVVRGNTDYGINDYKDNGNGTITDKATGLTWQQNDSEMSMDWPTALSYCENLNLAGRSNWRLPNAKELQSIVNYTKSPDTSNSAAIDPLFTTTSIVNEAGKLDYANYWSSTTHQNLNNSKNAVYIAFGRSLGYMGNSWMDVHGAGSQRSDPKVSDGKDYSQGHGPQGDAVRTQNYARCVTDSNTHFVQNPQPQTRESKVYTLTGKETRTSSKPNRKSSSLPDMGVKREMPSGKHSSSDLISKMDRNGDGKLSKSEAKGPIARDFDRFDINNDGYLDASEIPEPPERGRR
ncbi:DUF1566 domain-containing protein [Vibrio hannami]|nr:DUF1566 domain-containing protein [Vibrio hannami]MDG3085935.1 DUF1566 domain-containing protein [Vibrio hannami]